MHSPLSHCSVHIRHMSISFFIDRFVSSSFFSQCVALSWQELLKELYKITMMDGYTMRITRSIIIFIHDNYNRNTDNYCNENGSEWRMKRNFRKRKERGFCFGFGWSFIWLLSISIDEWINTFSYFSCSVCHIWYMKKR